MKTRLKILSLVILLAFLGLTSKLFYWQIIKGKQLSLLTKAQREWGRVLSAPRGNILSSDGSWLAARDTSWLVFASKPDLEDSIDSIADKLAPFLVEEDEERGGRELLLEEAGRLKNLLSRKESVWIPLKRGVEEEVKRNIESLGIEGIGFEPEEARIYPESSSSAHLLGFVGKNESGDDVGYFGLEGYYDMTLSGKPGFISQEFDARGTPILLQESEEVEAINGVDLLTHIDKSIQRRLEKKLEEGMERYGAVGGTAIIMNPKDGGILAMASFPSFDPANYSEYGDIFFKNPAISDIFEPGSIFKVLVMAAGLDSGAVDLDTKCDICDGPLKVDKYTIETWNKEYREDSSITDIIVHSDNVGMAFVGQKLGADTLFDYLDAFGMGKKTGVDLQGEVSGLVREKGTWNVVDLATASFGQGVSITPVQMVSAVSAIANGGMLYAPQVVDKLIGENWQEDIKPLEKGRVLSEKSAMQITAMMAEAAESGEAKWTYKRGFKVAGKTGTAQIPIAGHYDEEKTIASFVGFAPFDDPKFVMLVMLKEPATSPWASETAAPLWYSIAEDLFVYFRIQPER